MVDCQDTESIAVYLSKLTDATKTLFPRAIRDIKEVNRELQRVVDSGAETLNTTGNPRVSFEVENFKKDIRQSLITSDSFSKATRSVASYASNDRVLKSIEEELSKSQVQQKLKSYLNVVKERSKNCRERLAEIQSHYSNLSRLALNHRKRISEASHLSQMFGLTLARLTPATGGSGVIIVAGFVVTKLLMPFLKPAYLPLLPAQEGDSMEVLKKRPLVQRPEGTSSYFYDYLLPLLIGVTLGVGFFYLAKRFGFHRHLRSTYKEPVGVSMLQSVTDSIATFQSKLQINIRKLIDLERCLSEAIDRTSQLAIDNKKDAEGIKTQLDKLEQEMSELLTLTD